MLVAVPVYSDGHPAALPVALRLLLALPGGAACLPHAERAARHQLRPHALLLPDWLGRAGLRHGSGGGTGPRGLREPGLLLALALRHPRLESGGSRRVRGVGECSPLFAQTIDPSHETVTTRLTLSPPNTKFPRFLCSHCYTLGGAITHLLNESRITRSKTQTRKTQKPAISYVAYAYEK